MILATVGTRLGLGQMAAVAAMQGLPCRVGMVTPRMCVVERPRWTVQWHCELVPGQGLFKGLWWWSIQ